MCNDSRIDTLMNLLSPKLIELRQFNMNQRHGEWVHLHVLNGKKLRIAYKNV